MLINETITAAMETARAAERRAEQLRNITREPWRPEQFTTIEERKAAHAAMMKRTEDAANELAALEIETKIRHDNLRRMIYNEALPIALDILRKYNGKPYGEKTKEKISAEMKARCNCSLYLHRGYSADIDITPLNGDGHNHYYFKYDDFNIWVKYPKNGEKRPALDSSNKINGTLTPDDVYLSDCPEIVPDPSARAAEILAAFTELKRKQDQFEREITQFNNLLPSGIERRHISGFRNYL